MTLSYIAVGLEPNQAMTDNQMQTRAKMGINQYLVNIRGMDRVVHFTANGSRQNAR